MIHVEGETTPTPTVDYAAGTATVTCDICGAKKASFPLARIIRIVDDSLLVSSSLVCNCKTVTVYAVVGAEPIVSILTRLVGLTQ